MYPWEQARYLSAAHYEDDAQVTLTAEEIARLIKIRARYQGHPECLEFDLDERRLSFVRWLVDRGAIREDL